MGLNWAGAPLVEPELREHEEEEEEEEEEKEEEEEARQVEKPWSCIHDENVNFDYRQISTSTVL